MNGRKTRAEFFSGAGESQAESRGRPRPGRIAVACSAPCSRGGPCAERTAHFADPPRTERTAHLACRPRSGRPTSPIRRSSPASSGSALRGLGDTFRGSNAGRRPNPIPAWANGPGSWGVFKGRAEGPVHSEMGRTFRPPPGCRRFPGALPQAVNGPRRRRSDRPAHGPPWAPSALRLQRLLRFFAANFPNPFTADYADSADKKSASVLSVPSCKIRPLSDPSPASSVSELRGLCDKFRGSNAGRRPNPIPAWANGPGSWGIFKGRAEGPVHSEVGRTFRPPPGGRRCPGALPQALIGPRRWRSDRPAFRSS